MYVNSTCCARVKIGRLKLPVFLHCLQALFEIFFRVVKQCSSSTAANYHQRQQQPTSKASSVPQEAGNRTVADDASHSSSRAALLPPWPVAKVHRKFPLLQPTLEGLGRYSHLISVEYFNDLMSVLQQVSCTCS